MFFYSSAIISFRQASLPGEIVIINSSFLPDASTIESLLRSLHSDTRPGVLQPLGPLGPSPEDALLTRWRHIVDAMAPPRVPRNSKPVCTEYAVGLNRGFPETIFRGILVFHGT